jgi:hypothetical protein
MAPVVSHIMKLIRFMLKVRPFSGGRLTGTGRGLGGRAVGRDGLAGHKWDLLGRVF